MATHRRSEQRPLWCEQYAKNTTIIEQPVDFSKLAPKYNDFVLDFIEKSHADPFFLYMPFSHVHTTAGNQPRGRAYPAMIPEHKVSGTQINIEHKYLKYLGCNVWPTTK